MKKLLLLIFNFIFISSAFAVDIVYPKQNNVTINSSSTFFIGSSKTPVFINDKQIELHKSGAFAHVVPLKVGENTFVFQSDNEQKIYKITRNIQSFNTPKLVEFKKQIPYIVTKNNAPLRKTPVDAGMNRISHLQNGVLLKIDGELGNFYRVFLNDKEHAWIGKNNVTQTNDFEFATVYNFSIDENDKYYNLYFHANKKVPFEIVADDTFLIKFYNTKNETVFEFPYKKFSQTSKIYGYNAEYKDDAFILRIKKPPKFDEKYPLKNLKIVIDAGHGGSEFGAIGCFGDKEKDINLNVAKNLEQELKSKGANVIMTRDSDTNLSLNERVNITNQNDALLFISIHHNALPDNKNPNEYKGTSVYYYYNNSKELAQNILTSMVNTLNTNNDGLKQGSLAVIRNSNTLSILIEIAYMINPDDNEMIINEKFQQQAAKAIAEGIESFIKP